VTTYPKLLSHYPHQFFDIIYAVAVESREVEVNLPSTENADYVRFAFYAFRGLLRKTATESERAALAETVVVRKAGNKLTFAHRDQSQIASALESGLRAAGFNPAASIDAVRPREGVSEALENIFPSAVDIQPRRPHIPPMDPNDKEHS
jgi:hypothetical protein